MTGGDEFARQHPQLAADLDWIGQRAILATAAQDVQTTGQVDTDLIFGGLPVGAGFGVLVAGMTNWSWSLWLILPTVFLGMGVLVSVTETVKWLVLFAGRLAARSAWLRPGAGPDQQGGGRR